MGRPRDDEACEGAGSLSQVLAWLVLGLCGGKVVLQEALQVLEGGALFRILFPAVDHELVQGDRAVLWAGHPVASFHLFQHLPVVHAWEDKGHAVRAEGGRPPSQEGETCL